MTATLDIVMHFCVLGTPMASLPAAMVELESDYAASSIAWFYPWQS